MFAFLHRLQAVGDLFGPAAGPARARTAQPAGAPAEAETGDVAEAARLLGFWSDAEEAAPAAAPRQVDPRLLSDKSFDDLLANGSSADLEAAYAATEEPARKVKLWGAIAHNEVTADAVQTVAGAIGSDDIRVDIRNFVRAGTTADEIDEEVAHMLAEIDGHRTQKDAITAKDIEELAKRKELERRIEQTYGVNLTNTTDHQPVVPSEHDEPTERRVWSYEELLQVEQSLSREPEAVRKNNLALTEIKRASSDKMWDSFNQKWVDHPSIGAETDMNTGAIHVFDTGVAPANPDHLRPDVGDTSAFGGHTPENPITQLESCLSHELGHIAARGNPKAQQDFADAAGWTALDKTGIKSLQGKITQQQVNALANGAMVVIEGRLYHVQRNVNGDDELVSVPEGHIPEADRNQPETPFEKALRGPEKWSYAKAGPQEHFAETYEKAIHNPEQLYRDLVVAPAERFADLTEERDRLSEQLQQMRADGTDAASIEATRKQLERKDAERATAEADASSLKKQHQIMREEVCGMDQKKVDTKLAALKAQGLDWQKVEEFRVLANAAMTDDQLDVLADAYASGA